MLPGAASPVASPPPPQQRPTCCNELALPLFIHVGSLTQRRERPQFVNGTDGGRLRIYGVRRRGE